MKAQKDPLHSFANLPPEIETELRNHLRVFSFSAGESVFIQGASPKAVYLVANGRVKVVRGTPEGHEWETAPHISFNQGEKMNWFDRIVLLLTGLTAVYLIWQFYGRYQHKESLA